MQNQWATQKIDNMNPPLHTHSTSRNVSHNCEETLRQVLLLLDNRLDESEQSVLLENVKRCDDCLKKYNIEKEFKAFLHAKMVKKICTEQLRSQIRSIVDGQIN